jgi:ABC-type amino acid transport substrate-binding protein
MKKLVIAALLASVSLSAAAAQTIRFATEASYPLRPSCLTWYMAASAFNFNSCSVSP